MQNPRPADSHLPEDGRQERPLVENPASQLGVVTEVDLTSHHYPVSRVRWRPLLVPRGD